MGAANWEIDSPFVQPLVLESKRRGKVGPFHIHEVLIRDSRPLELDSGCLLGIP